MTANRVTASARFDDQLAGMVAARRASQVALQWLLQLAPTCCSSPDGSVAHPRENLAAEGGTLDHEALRNLDGVGS